MIELKEYVGSKPKQITTPNVTIENNQVVLEEDVEEQDTKDKE